MCERKKSNDTKMEKGKYGGNCFEKGITLYWGID